MLINDDIILFIIITKLPTMCGNSFGLANVPLTIKGKTS